MSPIGFFRRIGVIFYDALVVIAILFIATFVLLPFNGGNAIAPQSIWFQIYLLIIATSYFVLSWNNGGQTLGARAWKCQLTNLQGNKPTSAQVARRLLWGIPLALSGIGFLWLFKSPYTLYDTLSQTCLKHIYPTRRIK